MSRGAPAGLAMLAMAARGATLFAGLMLVGGVYALVAGPAAAADGPQGSPALEPAQVEAPTDPFSLAPPAGAACEDEGSGRSGADGWRWHTFIVEAGRDLSTLEFGPTGPGNDFDATDGQITASLIATGRGVWAEAPAVRPPGLINSNGLGGLMLDPSDYTLRDGRYLIGFACTDEASATRQWWSLEVTVQTSGAPFLTADTGALVAPTGPAGATSVIDAADATPTTVAPGDATTAPDPATSVVRADDGGSASADAAPNPADELQRLTGVSWSPLLALVDASSVLPVGAWAALVAVLARISYLLARPLRVLPLLAP